MTHDCTSCSDLRNRQGLLVEAIVKVAVAAGVTRGCRPMTGPEVLLMADATAEQVAFLSADVERLSQWQRHVEDALDRASAAESERDRLAAQIEKVLELPRTGAREEPNGYPVLTVRARDIDRAIGLATQEDQP